MVRLDVKRERGVGVVGLPEVARHDRREGRHSKTGTLDDEDDVFEAGGIGNPIVEVRRGRSVRVVAVEDASGTYRLRVG